MKTVNPYKTKKISSEKTTSSRNSNIFKKQRLNYQVMVFNPKSEKFTTKVFKDEKKALSFIKKDTSNKHLLIGKNF